MCDAVIWVYAGEAGLQSARGLTVPVLGLVVLHEEMEVHRRAARALVAVGHVFAVAARDEDKSDRDADRAGDDAQPSENLCDPVCIRGAFDAVICTQVMNTVHVVAIERLEERARK